MSEEMNKQENQEPEKKKTFWGEVLDWLLSIGIAVLAVALINMFVFVQVKVDGSSMYPTLHDGDRLFTWRLGYTPKQGDIIVLEPDLHTGSVKGKLMFGRVLYIKRVIAVAGQEIDIRPDGVYIDGKLYEEEYIGDDVHTYEGSLKMPQTIPEGCIFVMGDNREHSIDSRNMKKVGIVRCDQVVGKANLRIFPFKDIGTVK